MQENGGQPQPKDRISALRPGDKFAVIVATNVIRADDHTPEVELAPGVWFSPGSPYTLSEGDRQGLGGFVCDWLDRSDFCILVLQHSDAPDVRDAVDDQLLAAVHDVWFCLCMHLQGVPYADNLMMLGGAIDANGFRLKSIPTQMDYVSPPDCALPTTSLDDLKSAATLAQTYRLLFKGEPLPETHRRVRLGLSAVNRALHERYGDARLHDYVRALEALVMPRRGKTRSLFVHRCQTLAAASEANLLILREAYDLRCAREHMNDWLGPVAHHGADAENVARERLWQIEHVALAAYAHLLSTPALLDVFSDDASIREFWRKREGEQRALWGRGVNATRYRWRELHGIRELHTPESWRSLRRELRSL